MEYLAFIGMISLVIAAAVAVALPMCLAIWVSPLWMWLYAVYGAIGMGLLAAAATYAPKNRKGKGDDGQ